MFAKCANPLCPVRFNYRLGGKFFRFRRDQASGKPGDAPETAGDGSHNVEHFWLCPRCRQVLMLVYVEGRGVVIKLLGEKPSTVDSPEQLTAA